MTAAHRAPSRKPARDWFGIVAYTAAYVGLVAASVWLHSIASGGVL